MFKIAEDVMKKIESVLTANVPVLAENNGIKFASVPCSVTCTGSCAGSCKGSCTASCQRNSR